MTQNVDQVIAQGMDAASLHIWYSDAVKPALQEAHGQGHCDDLVLQPAARYWHSGGSQ
jgi:hypothetical protein